MHILGLFLCLGQVHHYLEVLLSLGNLWIPPRERDLPSSFPSFSFKGNWSSKENNPFHNASCKKRLNQETSLSYYCSKLGHGIADVSLYPQSISTIMWPTTFLLFGQLLQTSEYDACSQWKSNQGHRPVACQTDQQLCNAESTTMFAK